MLGALRSSAQIISYEIPLGMSILGVVLVTGSLNLETIIDYQVRHGWNILFQPLAFLLFLTSVFAECNRLPFDLPEAEQELVGGYHTEYSAHEVRAVLPRRIHAHDHDELSDGDLVLRRLALSPAWTACQAWAASSSS